MMEKWYVCSLETFLVLFATLDNGRVSISQMSGLSWCLSTEPVWPSICAVYNLSVNRAYVHSHTHAAKTTVFIQVRVCVPIQDGPPYVASGDVTSYK